MSSQNKSSFDDQFPTNANTTSEEELDKSGNGIEEHDKSEKITPSDNTGNQDDNDNQYFITTTNTTPPLNQNQV